MDFSPMNFVYSGKNINFKLSIINIKPHVQKTPFFIISASVIAVVVALFIALPSKQKPIKVDSEFKKYVTAFTSGIISKEANIRIQLRNPYADSSIIGKKVNKELFDFSPDIEGNAYWSDKHTVEFRPDEMLEADQQYNAEFYLSKLEKGIQEKFKTMEFSFRTIKQSMECRVGHMKFLPGKQIKWLKLTGKILTADVESLDNIRKTMEAKQGNKELDITFNQGKKSNIFTFKIDSIRRKHTESKVTLEWNGKEIGADEKGNKEIKVTKLGNFILRKVMTNQGKISI